MWPEHWHALLLFLSMDTQWRVAATMNGLHYIGLDYGVLPLMRSALRRPPHRQPLSRLLPQLQQLEAEALDLLNK